MGEWYYKTSCMTKSKRACIRSKTFPEVAQAIAD